MHDNTKTPIRTATRLLGGLTIVAAVFLGSPGAARADGTVAVADYQLWQANYGTVDSGGYHGDGDAADFVMWRRSGPVG